MSRPRIAAGVTVAASVAIGVCRYLIRRSFEARHASRFELSPDGVIRGAEPIALDGSPTHAVLLLHGFNDTPQSVGYLATALHAAGWTVRAPLLPGHGRDLLAMSSGRATSWLDGARRAYDALRATHDTVVLVGQSMGAALAVQLAVEPPEPPALVLLAPFIGVPPRLSLKFAASRIPQAAIPYRVSTGGELSIHDPDARDQALGTGVVTARVLHELQKVARRAEAVLPDVRSPVLYLQSVEDNRVRAVDAKRNFDRLGSETRELRWIEGAGHIIAVDYCRDEVARRTIDWIVRWAGVPSEVEGRSA